MCHNGGASSSSSSSSIRENPNQSVEDNPSHVRTPVRPAAAALGTPACEWEIKHEAPVGTFAQLWKHQNEQDDSEPIEVYENSDDELDFFL